MGSQTPIEEIADDELRDAGKGSKSGDRKRDAGKPSARDDSSLKSRLVDCFNRVAEQLEARDDPEFAEVLREESQRMATGLVSLTRPFKPARLLVTVFIAIVEPLLAFGRVGRILAERWADRRAQRQAQAQAEAEATAVLDPDA